VEGGFDVNAEGMPDQPIKAIDVLSSGTGEQHPEHRFGTRAPQWWWVLTSRRWVEAPLHCFAFEHRDGLVLFDTGLDPAIASDPRYISSAIGRFLLRRIFRLHIGPEDALDRKMRSLGLSASDVRLAVISHLHFDHIGGIAHIPQADLLVSQREWDVLTQPHPEREWILREHVEIPCAQWRQVTFTPTDEPLLAPFGGCHDVMGDGSMILLPTPGHTPGSLSMLVRSGAWPPLLFVGDLAYEARSIFVYRVPGTGDPGTLQASYAKVRGLKEALPDLVILPSHDPETVERLVVATRGEGQA
jgi:glyoxylase-like metal-dependent hydrolase (beta-lactamase superfamily II)